MLNLNLKKKRSTQSMVKQKHDPKNTFVNKDDRNDVVDEGSITRVGDRPVEMNPYCFYHALRTNLFQSWGTSKRRAWRSVEKDRRH
jgi:hypothetical protein